VPFLSEPPPSAPRYRLGSRVYVTFDDGIEYAGTVTYVVAKEEPPNGASGAQYSIGFDDGDQLDAVAEAEIRAAPRFAMGDRVSVEFSGRGYAGTIDGVLHGSARDELLYAVEFDDGERLCDIAEAELRRIQYQPKTMPSKIADALPLDAALNGPRAIKARWSHLPHADGCGAHVEMRAHAA